MFVFKEERTITNCLFEKLRLTFKIIIRLALNSKPSFQRPIIELELGLGNRCYSQDNRWAHYVAVFEIKFTKSCLLHITYITQA